MRLLRPAAVIALDLVSHSLRRPADAQTIQSEVRAALERTRRTLAVAEVVFNYTGDGYVCALLGDASSRAVDFLRLALPDLVGRLQPYGQAFRVGADIGFVWLQPDELTGGIEHFGQPGIHAARLEAKAEPNQVLCTDLFCLLFAPHWPNSFSASPVLVETKDRMLRAFEFLHEDLSTAREQVATFLFGTPEGEAHSERHTIRVLFVDDEPDIRAVVEDIGASYGWEVVTVGTGHDALRTFSAGRFDVVLTDIMMPGGLGGIQLTRAIRSQDPKVPVAAITGYSSAALAEELFEAGGSAVLEKPFRREDLRSLVIWLCGGGATRLRNALTALGEPNDTVLQPLWRLRYYVETLSNECRGSSLVEAMVRHKLRHMVNDFLAIIGTGKDSRASAGALMEQARTMRRLLRIYYLAARLSFIDYVRRCVADARKRYPALRVSLSATASAADMESLGGHAATLSLVAAELLDNAVDATKGTGSIWIKVFTHSATATLNIVVHDSGPGIPAAELSRVFDEGYSTKGAGRGLGLLLVSSAIERMGGKLSTTPRERSRKGARFVIEIPLENFADNRVAIGPPTRGRRSAGGSLARASDKRRDKRSSPRRRRASHTRRK